MPSENELRINTALEGRRSQRQRAAELSTAWSDLCHSFEKLDSTITEAARSAADVSSGAAIGKVSDAVDELRTILAGHRDVWARLGDIGRRIAALQSRVERDTVNIGVLGKTRAGKSTLLRGITALDKDVIPSSDWDSTTAAPSRIYHDPSVVSAVVELHTWESFRSSYLQLLHDSAGFGPAPLTPREFAEHRYPEQLSPNERADRQRFLDRLLTAQRSLPSYEPLLRSGGTLPVSMSELSPYLAYPADGDPDQQRRPYHAVSGVVIRNRFTGLEVARLGLIDLPGAGEAGLNVDQQFLQRLRNELDMLLVVKRTMANETFWSEADWDSVGLADSVRGGVPLEDFVAIVVNQDESQLEPEGLAITTRKMRAEAAKRGMPVYTPNAQRPSTLQTELMEPLLRHLAAKLADMDRAAIGDVRAAAEELAAEVGEIAREVTDRLAGWESAMPDQEKELMERARLKRYAVAGGLGAVSDRYDRAAAGDDEVETDFRKAVRAAVTTTHAWVDKGFGAGGMKKWIAENELTGSIIAEEATTRERQFALARAHVGDIFGRLDTAVDEAIRRLFAEIAAAMRTELTDGLVPDEPDALQHLKTAARGAKASTMAAALDELAGLRAAFGSTLVRVTQPIVRRIRDRPHEGFAVASTLDAAARNDAAAVGRLLGRVGRAAAAEAVPGLGLARETAEAVRDASRSFGESQGRVGGAQQAAEALYEDLTTTIRDRVAELENALAAENRVMAAVMASAIDRFLDRTASSTPHLDLEYKKLCAVVQRVLWPDLFDGGPAQLGAALTAVESSASALSAAISALRRLER